MSRIAPLGWAGRLGLPLLFLVSFALRLGAVAALVGLDTPPRPGGDEAEYDAIAWNLARGEGFRGISPDVVNADGSPREHPTAYRPPVTPTFFAAVYALAGHNYAAGHVADSLLASSTVLLVFFIARRVFGCTAAWGAAVLYAFYPLAVYYNLTLQSETHAAFLVCLFVWLALPFRDSRGAWWAAATGLCLGVLLLCKPGFVFLVPLLPAWAVAVCRKDLVLWRRAVLIPAAAGLVVLPWAARNYQEFGSFIPFGTGGGSLLLQANNRIVVADPRYHGYAVWDTSLPEYAPALRAANDEVARDAVAKQMAVQWLKENPDKWLYLARGKFWRLWTPAYVGAGNRHLAWVASVYYGAVLLAFAVAVLPVSAWLWRRRDPGLMLLMPVLATVLMAVVFHGQHRYRFPIDSLCMIVAAGGLSLAAGAVTRPPSEWRRCARRAAAVLAAGAALAGLFLAARAADEVRINTYRANLTGERLQAVEAAVAAYRHVIGRPPDRLEDLIPDFLPNAEALHAPTHSLEYADYQLLPARDARAAARVVSFRIEKVPGSEGGVRIVQTHGRSEDGPAADGR